MTGYVTDIEKDTLANEYFRKVVFTAPNCQLVLMAIAPGDDIGMETHDHGDQFIRIEGGTGSAVIDGAVTAVEDGSALVVPAGSAHNIINGSKTEPLKLYTVYSPPHHPDGTVHKTKADAVEAGD